MKKRPHLLLLLTLLFLTLESLGQVQEVKREMELFNYSKAIELALKHLKLDKHKNDTSLLNFLGVCYEKQNKFNEAAQVYSRIYQLDKTRSDIVWKYAESMKITGHYEGAKQLFLRYDSLTHQPGKGIREAAICDTAVTWLKKLPLASVQNTTPWNSPQTDFGPYNFDGGWMICSDRIAGADSSTYGWTGHGYLHFMQIQFDSLPSSSGQLKVNSINGLKIPDGHVGPGSFDPIHQEFYYTQSIPNDRGRKDGKRIRTHLLKIECIKLDQGKWVSGPIFELNGKGYSVGHPAFSPDGNSLYFVSDKPGGRGGTDLYVTNRTQSGWSEPINLGNEINSSGNEMFPWMSKDGTLWYSSDGCVGLGGLDVFSSTFTDGKWRVPQNAKPPINSSYDDFAYVRMDDTTSFVSSNRAGGVGNDDIYQCRPIPRTHTKVYTPIGVVADLKTNQPIAGATVFMKISGEKDVLVLKTDHRGRFFIPYQPKINSSFKATNSGYFPHCLSVIEDCVNMKEDSSILVKLFLEKIEVNKTYTLSNIYYNFDKWEIRDDAKPALDELVKRMKESPIKVELGSHTDCRGSIEYNLVLSQKRAESAVRYIVEQGIDSTRIMAKGYGKSQLINRCSCSGKDQCSEEEHQMNRRTEFEIVEIAPQMSVVDFATDSFKDGEKITVEELPTDFFGSCKPENK